MTKCDVQTSKLMVAHSKPSDKSTQNLTLPNTVACHMYCSNSPPGHETSQTDEML